MLVELTLLPELELEEPDCWAMALVATDPAMNRTAKNFVMSQSPEWFGNRYRFNPRTRSDAYYTKVELFDIINRRSVTASS
jgi:hypothetical protein